MNEAIIATLLEWNPWFESNMPEDLLGLPRDYDVLSYIALPEIKILEGVRRSGKSTLLYQIIQQAFKDEKKALYINFDDEILKQYSLSDIYYAFLQHSQIDYLLIDEIQQCKEWVPTIRKFYDRKDVQQIWLTGSNSSLIKKEYAELLTGRNIRLDIMPLSFKEFLVFKNEDNIGMPITKKREAKIKVQFTEYLANGAFPAIALRSIYQRELLNSYFEDFLYKDIASRYDVNIAKLKDLAIYLITNSTKALSYRKIASYLGLHANTVSDYISYMKEVFLFDEIYRFDYSLKKQYTNDKKIYAIDTGLANAVSFRFSENKGQMLETIVYQHLKRLGKEIYFHFGKKECDFIVKEGLEITGIIQVCTSIANHETRERELAGLEEALNLYHPQKVLLLTLDEVETINIKKNDKTCDIPVMPVWKWMLET